VIPRAIGPTIDELIVGDEPAAWEAAGFTVDSNSVCRIGSVRVRLVGRSEGKRIRAWSLRDLPAESTIATGTASTVDGLPTCASDRPPAEPGVHRNGARFIDHVVVVTPNHDRTVSALRSIGLEPRRTRETDQYGPPFFQTFFRAGEVIVELIGPQQPNGDGPASFFGIAHTVDDLDATKRLLGDALGQPKPAVQPARRIATLRHKMLDISVATAFMSPEPGAIASDLTG
jgi:hypothetical protein